MSWSTEYPRRVPERRPAGHQPRAPRWSTRYEVPLTAVTCDYLAIQVETETAESVERFLSIARDSHATDGPQAWELLSTTDSSGLFNLIHLGYWTDPTEHARWAQNSPLGRWFRDLQPQTVEFGAWHEVVQAPLDRIETVFSDPRGRFGFAQCPSVLVEPMTTNGYYGAMRDRFPISAIDTLEAVTPHRRREQPAPSLGARLRAGVGNNTVAIRSGQYWQQAEGEQLDDYETQLEPKLLRGMSYLDQHRETTGTMSLRILRRIEPETRRSLRETCTYAYFHSLEELEEWAASHATHAAIFEHAIDKNREYGAERTVTTWHEVFLLPETATFEYVNCHPTTGLLEFAPHIWRVIDD